MALFTRHDRVQPDQGEFSDVMVKAHLGAPATLIVTGVTFLSLLPLVHIIEQMTAYAIHFQLLFIYIILLMASGAFYFYVLTFEFEFCLTVVIKFNLAPGLLIVTVLAFLTETAGVLVIVLVAGVTIGLDLDLEGVFRVAGYTRHLGMTSA